MLESKSLYPKMCVEAINYVAYIENQVPHKDLKGTTPFEAWTGNKPDVSPLKYLVPKLGIGFL